MDKYIENRQPYAFGIQRHSDSNLSNEKWIAYQNDRDGDPEIISSLGTAEEAMEVIKGIKVLAKQGFTIRKQYWGFDPIRWQEFLGADDFNKLLND